MINKRDSLGRFKKGVKYQLGFNHSQELKDRFSKERIGKCSNSGKTHFKKGYIPWNKGLKVSDEAKLNISKKLIGNSNAKKGKESNLWIDGRSKKNEDRYRKLKKSFHWKYWRKKVFERDDYTCKSCASKSGEGKTIILEPHHRIPVCNLINTIFERYVFNINNGLTLCKDCHNKTKSGRPRGDGADILGGNGPQEVPSNNVRE